ncbi:phosphate ABC transporter permease PstA [Alkalinema sp. FACHB-956]|uniref:phosphate ABC transporter permease PstA n=1 Tax=Alkalinema sp. FACHB-956 TaxID=2692768 RepID=UPI001683EB9D|nr:phosphate ABC transporter permease PstA [Alkalinema sp. FACHB-956]MBD2329590.1 phosphate ABC transporter permease PstA [Alkalinema sp. FACHB-956]
MSDSQPFISRSLHRNPWAPRTLFSNVMTGLAIACAVIAIVPLVAVLLYVLINGVSRLDLNLFTQVQPPPRVLNGGLGNALQGTLYTVGIATLLAVPFGVMAAVFLSEFVRDTRLARWIGFATNVLSGVPSIVAGTFIYSAIVLTTKTFSAFSGGVALAILMLPVIVRTATEALELVPSELRQAAVGLGATRFQTVAGVVLPAALPGIITGVMLSVARAAGETAPVLFTALGWPTWIQNIWQQTNTLSLLVYKFATAPYPNQQQLAWAGSLLLVLLVLVTNILARFFIRRKI